MTVRRVRVGEVLSLHRVPVQIDEAETYRQIGIYSWGKGFIHRPACLGLELSRLRYFQIPAGALVLSNIQAWEAAIAVSTDADTEFIGSNRFLSYLPRTKDVDVRYLLHYFLSEPGLHQLRQASPGTQVRNRTLGQQLFERLEVPLPDLPEQQRIANDLDRLTERSHDLSRSTPTGSYVLRLLPRILDRIWKSARLPDTTVGELCRPINDLVKPGQDPSPAKEFVGLEFLQPHTGLRLGAGPVTGLTGRKFRFHEGDVLYGYLRPYQNKVWAADRAGLCSVEQYVLRPEPHVDPTLLSLALRSSRVLDYAVDQTNSLQLPRLGIRALLSASVPDVRLSPEELVSRLQSTTSNCVLTASLTDRRNMLSASLLPAARNDAFATLT